MCAFGPSPIMTRSRPPARLIASSYASHIASRSDAPTSNGWQRSGGTPAQARNSRRTWRQKYPSAGAGGQSSSTEKTRILPQSTGSRACQSRRWLYMRRGVRPAGTAIARSGLAAMRSRTSAAAASASSTASRKTTSLLLRRHDLVGGGHLLGEDLRRDELRVQRLEVLLRDPTGQRAAPSDPDGHAVLDDLADHLGERWHADRLHRGRDVLLHEIGGLAGDEDLRRVARLDGAEREVEGQPGARRIVGA